LVSDRDKPCPYGIPSKGGESSLSPGGEGEGEGDSVVANEHL